MTHLLDFFLDHLTIGDLSGGNGTGELVCSVIVEKNECE